MSEERARRWSPLELIRVTAPFFENRGIDNARLNAELLLAHVLEWKRLDLYTRFETVLDESKVDAFRELVRRRGNREPLQHLLGKTEFRSMEILCDARALTPRPETEILVEEVIRCAEGKEAPLIADVGAGSGCIAVSLAQALPSSQIVATDVSLEALEVALGNVELHGLSDRIRLLEGDLAEPLLAEGYAGKIDIIASNPPYVATDEFEDLQPEVRDYEPRQALDGGADGLDFYRRFFRETQALAKPDMAVALELPDKKSADVQAIAEDHRWQEIEIKPDHAGIPRVLAARWRG